MGISLNKIHSAKAYLKYWLKAKDEHSVHSPYIFNLINQVLYDTNSFYKFEEIEGIRNVLLNSKISFDFQDFGAGSTIIKGERRFVKDIAKWGTVNARQGTILFKLAHFIKPKVVLELGTSLGFSTMYLASGTTGQIHTIEADKTLLELSKQNFKQLKLKNIESYQGTFNDVLPTILKPGTLIDIAFIDGHHDREATLNYFKQIVPFMSKSGVLIFDDIHWSKGMTEAWKDICQSNEVTVSIDLFNMGLVFLNPDFTKQHFVLKSSKQ